MFESGTGQGAVRSAEQLLFHVGFWLKFCGAATLSERITSRLTDPDGENEPRV